MAALQRIALVIAALLAAGCASIDPFAHAPIAQHLQRTDGVGDCARLLRELDRRVLAADARDAQAPLVPGFPYLRVDRLSASVAPAADDAQAFRLWRARLAQLDRDARLHEFRNATGPSGPVHGAMSVDACRNVLLDADEDADARAALRAVAQVPDDYSIALRALGLYPLTKLAFAAGIRRWHADTREVFALPLEALPVQGQLRRYALEHDGARGLVFAPDRWRSADGPIEPITRDALGVPRVASLSALFARHAPVVEVDQTGDFDRIGPLALVAKGTGSPYARVDLTQPPVAYARLAFGRLGGVLRPQLVYTFWFPARPKDGRFDLLGGELDAIIWRVTLDDEGRALVYDSIHACGCYHLFFPTAALRLRAVPPPDQGRFDEGLFMPQDALAVPRADERVVLRVASRTHYLQRAYLRAQQAAPDSIAYRLRDEDELRSLTIAGDAPDGRSSRSAYDADGMIPGTERLERLFFWPMGIASAGQMRQWGRHATAFVGRRHFDDPVLLERYFDMDTQVRIPRPGARQLAD
jgi:hypothetical protein